ncbi:hypothetical protein [Sphingomonas koreensis]|jgi:hypothetical protein|nr:hypothetical protein [Sphingomonas koreensis]MDC7811849.1 hypothetical protein [Sphingomonas koreensis]
MTDATKLGGKCLCGAVRARIALPEPQSNTVIDDVAPSTIGQRLPRSA